MWWRPGAVRRQRHDAGGQPAPLRHRNHVRGRDPAEAFAGGHAPEHARVFAESLGNPSLTVLDIAAVAEVAHAHGVPLIVDNTVPSPFLCQPLALGADIVVHSATSTWAATAPRWPA